MKRIILILALLGGLSTSSFAKSTSLSRQMEEWNRLQQTSETSLTEQDLAQAAQAANQAIRYANRHFGPFSKPSAQSAWQQALVWSESEDQAKALRLTKKALKTVRKAYGNHPFTWKVQLHYGRLLSYEGKFTEAKPYLHTAFQGLKQAQGLKNNQTLKALAQLAEIEEALGRFDAAAALLQEGIAALANLSDADEEVRLTLLEQSASVYKKLGKYAQAAQLADQVYQLNQQAYGEKAYETWLALRTQGDLARLRNQYDQALTLLNRAAQGLLALGGEQDPDYWLTQAYLGQTFAAMGKYKEAESYGLKVYQFDMEFYGPQDLNTLIDLNNLAGLRRLMGRWKQAEQNYLDAVSGLKSLLGPDHPETLSALGNLALLYENRGFFEQAEPLMKEVYQKSKASLGPAHPKTLAAANNLAMLMESQGVFTQAVPLYQEAIQAANRAYGANSDFVLRFRNNLAFLYLMQKNYALALDGFEQVFAAWQGQLGLQHPNTLKALNNVGRAQMGLNQLPAALATLTRALALRGKALGKNHPDVIRSQIDLGQLFIQQKKYQQAIAQLQSALKVAEKRLGKQHPYTYDALNALIQAQDLAGQGNAALLNAYEGFQRRNSFFQTMLWVTGANTRQAYIDLHRGEQDKLLDLLSRSSHPVAPYLALEVSLKRKGLLLKISSEVRKVVAMQKDPDLKEKALRLDAARKELANLTLKGPQDLSPEAYQNKTTQLETETFKIEALLGQSSKAYRDTQRQITVDEVLPALKENHALIDYQIFSRKGEERLLAVVLTKEKETCLLVFSCEKPTAQLLDLGPYETITTSAQEFRDSIISEDADEESLEESGAWIYSLLWEPLKDKLGGRTQVYLVQDGVLNIVPFDAIPLPESHSVLLEEFLFKELNSTRDLVLTPPPPTTGQYVILAGPDYDVDFVPSQARAQAYSRGAVNEGIKLSPTGLRSLSFVPLLGAKVEGESINQVVKNKNQTQALFLTGKKAEEARLREMKTAPEVLHIATHGFFLKKEERLKQRLLSVSRGGNVKPPPPGDNPLLRAGLAFAGINANAPLLGEIDSDNDGVLTAMEVLSLNLYGTQMVVLSACETGLGEIHAGEGVYGLRRAFQEAGVARVVNSLWAVSDEATKDLMTAFYAQMLEGIKPPVALRQAKLALLHSDSWGHPYFWSAFQMVDRYE